MICGSGHAALEACMVNTLERGEVVLVCEKGLWGQRAAEVAGRTGLKNSVDPGRGGRGCWC